MPRIAIDYTPAYEQGGGIGRYVRELCAALSSIDSTSEYQLFVAGATSSELPDKLAQNFAWKPTLLAPKWLARFWQRARIPIPVEVFTGLVDLYHATDFVLPPTLPSTKTILTVHDLSFVRVPETASPALKAYLDKAVPRSVAKADHILADSQATKDDLIELYATSSDKISVLLSGVDSRFQIVNDIEQFETIKRKFQLPDKRYILSVGTVQPRKNYSRIVRALSFVRKQGIDCHYAIVGGKGWMEDEMYETIENENMADFVHLLGFVDDSDLPAIYTNAECLVITSLYEGFGLPILEAMACGAPVITSNLSSLPEVAGEAGILVNPLDQAEINSALYDLLSSTELRTELVTKGHQQVKQFTWAKSAHHLRAIYQQVLNA